MSYPFNYPFAPTLYRLGVTLHIQIEIIHDGEAGVYIATSPNLAGLVLESESVDQLTHEVSEAIPNLLALSNGANYANTFADVIYKDHIALA